MQHGGPGGAPGRDMAWIPGGAFLMGSDQHYAEEAPAHLVKVDGFWIDRHAVTNAEFARFVRKTGYETAAEQVPDPASYPGARSELLVPGSSVFRAPPHRGPERSLQLVGLRARCDLAASARAGQPGVKNKPDHPVVHVTSRLTRPGPVSSCLPRLNGNWPAAAAWTARLTPGASNSTRVAAGWPTPGRASPRPQHGGGRLRGHRAGRLVPGERLPPGRHDRERLGVDERLVPT